MRVLLRLTICASLALGAVGRGYPRFSGEEMEASSINTDSASLLPQLLLSFAYMNESDH